MDRPKAIPDIAENKCTFMYITSHGHFSHFLHRGLRFHSYSYHCSGFTVGQHHHDEDVQAEVNVTKSSTDATHVA